MNKLFELSNQQLREAFVGGRFAQSRIFGRSDIEEWLRQQRISQTPDTLSFECWSKYLESDFIKSFFSSDSTLQFLQIYCSAMPAEVPEIEGMEESARRECRQVLSFTDCDKNRQVYFRFGLMPIVYLPGESMVLIFGKGDGGITLSFELTSSVLTDAILAEWSLQKPKADQAREFLCNMLAKHIAGVREEAEADFDRAVAVSEDGKSIVIADWVVVFKGGETLFRTRNRPISICRAARFFKNKIKLSGKRTRDGYSTNNEFSGEKDLDQLAGFIKSHVDCWAAEDQVFAHMGKNAVPIFITKESFCSSWPADGHIVTL